VQLPQLQIREVTFVRLVTTVHWEVTNLRSVLSVLIRKKKALHQSEVACPVSLISTTTCLDRVVARSVDQPLLPMVVRQPALVTVKTEISLNLQAHACALSALNQRMISQTLTAAKIVNKL